MQMEAITLAKLRLMDDYPTLAQLGAYPVYPWRTHYARNVQARTCEWNGGRKSWDTPELADCHLLNCGNTAGSNGLRGVSTKAKSCAKWDGESFAHTQHRRDC